LLYFFSFNFRVCILAWQHLLRKTTSVANIEASRYFYFTFRLIRTGVIASNICLGRLRLFRINWKIINITCDGVGWALSLELRTFLILRDKDMEVQVWKGPRFVDHRTLLSGFNILWPHRPICWDSIFVTGTFFTLFFEEQRSFSACTKGRPFLISCNGSCMLTCCSHRTNRNEDCSGTPFVT
jgi:hypothetical protein